MKIHQLLKSKIAAGVAFMATLTLVSSASAAVLFTDNFNIGPGGNVDNNANLNFDFADRQAGPLAPVTYTGTANHHQVGNTGTYVGQPGGATNGGYVLTAFNGNWQNDLSIAAVSTGPLTIEFDLYEQTNSSTEWGACSLRAPGTAFPVAGANEFGFLRRHNGGVQVFQNGGSINPGGWDTANFALDPHWKLIFTDTAGTGSAFVGNGSKVTMINGTAWTNTLTLSQQLKRSGLKLGFNASSPTDPVTGGIVGFDNLVISGTQSAVLVTTTNQSGASPFTPSYTLETPNLIAGLAPATFTGNFTLETSGGTPVLTDGAVGISGDHSTLATCGGGSGSGSTLIYTLTNSINGSDVTNIVVYTGWGDGGRYGQYYDLSYSTVSAPTTYIPITTVFSLPGFKVNSGDAGPAPSTRVTIATTNGAPLGSAVANIKFEFNTPPNANTFNNGYQGYSEIIVQGKDTAAPPPPPSPYLTQDTLPTRAETVVGDQVVFTAAYSNSPPANLQWLFVTNGVTNVISGATSPTLTLNNVQTNSTGLYLLKAVNATNGAAAPSYSTAAPLAVGTPTTVGNVIMQYAGQAGPTTNFYPAWTIATNTDLIFGYPTDGSGNPGTATAGLGNFGLEAALAGDPTILGDGTLGDGKPTLVSCGPLNGAGLSMTYNLNTVSATNGFDLTNIVVFGGWPDTGRNEQKYQVLYSTVAAPATFSSIGTFDYNPTFTSGEPNATRVTLIPATGVLAQNVAAVQINWNLQGSVPKNGWEGYSEITISGTPSAPRPVLTQDISPLTAEDVVGSSLTMTANFTGATSFQWQKNGTNISGANSPTLTLNNLQLTDTATNGGYRLTAANGAGTSVTRGCTVIIRPAPTAVANVTVAFANQTSDAGSFTPTWDTAGFASSLISGFSPSDFGTGNFNDPDGNLISQNQAGGLPVLTDADYGFVVNGGTHPAFATCGPTAGQYVTYTLPANANGYDLTNIVVASGWNDDGRNADWCTVLYSTTVNPTTFIPLAVVTNRPILGAKSEIRATLKPVTGVLASGVYAIKLDFTAPTGIPNGYSGFSQINVFGSASAAPPTGPVVTVANENPAPATPPDWVIETPNLIANQLPSSVGSGNFTIEAGVTGVSALTDGQFQNADANSTYATCGNAAGTSVTYTAATGWNLTNIVVYSGWGNYDRDGQFYNITYSTLSAPSTFVPLASVTYNPPALTGPAANRVQIAPGIGAVNLATNVYQVKFDFTPQAGQDNGYSGYAEIVLQGSSLAAPTVPVVNPVTISGGNLIVTGTGTPNYSYTVLTTTNLLTPLANWTISVTGVTDGTGAYSNSVPVDASQVGSFFRVRMP